MPAHLYKGRATIKLDGYRKKDTIETRAVCIRVQPVHALAWIE